MRIYLHYATRTISVAILCLLAACVESPSKKQSSLDTPIGVSRSITVDSSLAPAEKRAYDEKKDALRTTPLYHEIVLNPEAVIGKLEGQQRFPTLNVAAPIYLLGIEKPKRRGLIPKHSCHTNEFPLGDLKSASREGYDAACQTLDDMRMQVLTHVVRFDGIGSGIYQRPCFLYNVYYAASSCSGTSSAALIAAKGDLYLNGVDAIDSLSAELESHLSGVTHIIVLSTGWNTHQDESLYDYLEWMAVLQSQVPAGTPFNPLYLGFSWQSKWDFGYAPIKYVSKISVANKGNDADEVGLRWASRLVNQVVMPLASAKKLPVVLVGHSYGTRILGTALYRRDVNQNVTVEAASPLAFLALEPAFTLNRFEKGKESTFATYAPPSTLVAMTASQHDAAGGLAGTSGIPYALSERGIRRVTAGDFPLIKPGEVSVDGHLAGTVLHRPGLYLLDASRIVNDHNDVYDKEVGTLFWDVMQAAGKAK